jgi:hypothetical protein
MRWYSSGFNVEIERSKSVKWMRWYSYGIYGEFVQKPGIPQSASVLPAVMDTWWNDKRKNCISCIKCTAFVQG